MDYLDKAKNLYKDKKVLVLGLGLNQGGVGVTKFLSQAGANLKVTDLKSEVELKPSLEQLKDFPNIEYILGQHRYEDIDWAEIVIKNPALKPDNPYVTYAKDHGKEVEMDMGIFLQFVSPEKIIGVTGTKGKSTTSSLIYEILKNSNKKSVFAGNIGKSVLDTIPYVEEDTLVVLELSSFQLEAFHQHQVSPKWAVITNIFPDHLNYYGSMEKYIEAKKWIALHQSELDFLFLWQNSELTQNAQFLEGLQGQIIYFSREDLPLDFSPALPGEHNLINMAAALSVTRSLGIKPEQVIDVIKNFKGVEFRLQLIKDVNGIKIYNDTAATNPDAAIQALKSLPNSILITGGVNKNLPYDQLAKAIDEYAKEVYFLIGDASDEIKNQMGKKEKIKGEYDNLERLVTDVAGAAGEGSVILFSPGAASFNLFKNEFDRGRQFNEAVTKIFS